jgi:hypothetical protein
MCYLKSISHNLDDAGAIECEVISPLLLGHEDLFDVSALAFQGVDTFMSSEVLGHLKLFGIDVYTNDMGSSCGFSSLDDGKTNSSKTKNSNTGSRSDFASIEYCTPSCRNTATEHAHLS